MLQTQYVKALVERLVAAPLSPPPAPWRRFCTHAVGGLLAIGYAPHSDYLLVVSSAGRGVYDALSGERIARDREAAGDWLNAIELTTEGIGPLATQSIRTGGLFGGGLPLLTSDRWNIAVITAPWPTTHVFLVEPQANLYGAVVGGVKVEIVDICEFRAAGFSETGNSFAVATSCDLTLYSRTQ